MPKTRDHIDTLIDRIEEATEQAKHYQGIVNGHDDGEIDFCLSRDEAERIASSWVLDLDTLSELSNLMVDTMWDMSILTYSSKRSMLIRANENRHRGKMSIETA